MKSDEKTRTLLIKHCQSYPQLQVQDVLKYLYQSVFGCEHFVSDEVAALDHIRSEYNTLSVTTDSTTESLDGAYSRVHLSCLKDGLNPKTLAKLFCLSAKKEQNGKELLEQKLCIAKKLVADGVFPFDRDVFDQRVDEWRAIGCPSVHHSDDFRAQYRPAYRVVANRYADFLSLFAEIDRLSHKDSCIIVIEGGSASGKTTLATILQEVYDCNVFHMDDFFLRPEQRTAERFAEIGGNVDRERFEEEILQPLKKNETVCYRRFDCRTQTLEEPITVAPKKISIIEGAYSLHPTFNKYADLSVFLDIDAQTQKARILKRNTPPFANRFFDEWIPLENKYFENTNIKNRVDLILAVPSLKSNEL